MILPIAFISPVLGRILASIAERYDYLIPSMFSAVLLIVFIIATISIRIYVHQTCFKKTDKITGGLEMLPKRKIKIRPKKLSNYLIAIFGYFLFSIFSIVGGGLTLTYNNPTFILVSSGIGFMFLIMNTIFINIGDAKVKYLENPHSKSSVSSNHFHRSDL